jgi:hypothetical protein
MRELVFALTFRGTAGPVPGVEGRRQARTTATSQVWRTLLTRDGIDVSIEPAGDGEAALESEVQPTGDGRFVEWGTIRYGQAGSVAFETLGEGVIRPSPVEGVRWGTVMWTITRGEGRFAGARGLITSNFTVTADGEVTDNHFARMFLPGPG